MDDFEFFLFWRTHQMLSTAHRSVFDDQGYDLPLEKFAIIAFNMTFQPSRSRISTVKCFIKSNFQGISIFFKEKERKIGYES